MNDSNQDNIEQPPLLRQSRVHRGWLVIVGLLLLLAVPSYLAVRKLSAGHRGVVVTPPPQEATTVASFRADFRPEQPAPGWRYYWNPNGPVGDTNGYVPLIWTGQRYSTTDKPLPARPPAGYLRLSSRSGHPGHGSVQMSAMGRTNECAVIVAFTLPEPGRYAIIDSFVARHDGAVNGDVHLQVFVNDRESGPEVHCSSREGVPFDRELGTLAAGDSVYVSVGAGDADQNDSFSLDFSLSRF